MTKQDAYEMLWNAQRHIGNAKADSDTIKTLQKAERKVRHEMHVERLKR